MATYYTTASYDSANASAYGSWAQTFGQALTSFGWVPQSGHGEVVTNYSGGSNIGSNYAWSNSPFVGSTQLTTFISTSFAGAWVNGTSYTGGATTSVGANVSVVTNGGLTYICTFGTQMGLTAVAVSGGNAVYTMNNTPNGGASWIGMTFAIAGFTNSGNNTTITVTAASTTSITCVATTQVNETHAGTATLTTAIASATPFWQPYNFEIFASSGPLSSTLPIFMKIEYFPSSTANAPSFIVRIGQGVDSNGNISPSMDLRVNTPTSAAPFQPNSAASFNPAEMFFSGDSDSFRFLIFKDISGNASLLGQLLAIERSRSVSGSATDEFVYVGYHASGVIGSGIMYNSNLGIGTSSTASVSMWTGTLITNGTTTTNSGGFCGGQMPVPTFPLVGQISNPLLGAMSFTKGEGQEGSIVGVWIYGSSHKYILHTTILTGTSTNGVPNALMPAILWE